MRCSECGHLKHHEDGWRCHVNERYGVTPRRDPGDVACGQAERKGDETSRRAS